MGRDFAHHQLFCDTTDVLAFHRDLLRQLPLILRDQGYRSATEREQTDRVLVVGPPGRWIWIYDSVATGDAPGNDEVEHLAKLFSTFSPVVDIFMYDSMQLHFFLYQDGQRCDQFVSAPAYYLAMLQRQEPSTAYQEQDFYGQPETWGLFLTQPMDSAALRKVWQQKGAEDILDKTADLVGWDSAICHGGYTINDDGYEFRYDEHPNCTKTSFATARTYYFVKTST
jgi:hypothetical protein